MKQRKFEPYHERLVVAMTKTDYDMIKEQADRKGLSLSTYVRETIKMIIENKEELDLDKDK